MRLVQPQMPIQKTLGRGLASSAQLALVAFLSIGLTATTHESAANTLPSLKMRVSVTAPTQEDLAVAEQTDRLDRAMAVLSLKDAALYRTFFAAQQRGDWHKADKALSQVSDKRLLGHALADRIEKRGASTAELEGWLKNYSTLPDAEALYAKAIKAGLKNAPKPEAPDTWSGGEEVDGAANFTPDLMVSSTAPNSENNAMARTIRVAVRRGDPWAARDLLIKAQAEKKLTGTFAHDVEAIIASSFFAVGERDQATALAGAAAGANQPLGLWIRGLIAWERSDIATARAMFSHLAAHPALSDSNRAAASFWAYRAESRDGSKSQARKYLEASASVPRSFYGLLACQLLGRNPFADLSDKEKRVTWNKRHRQILVENPAGWRALALVQVGENARAEAELRRLNPQGEADKQQAMLALADYVPMPALALQIAHLSKARSIDTALYPLPPWQPQEGFQVDRALLFALARHESLFDPTAISSRGAHGLLQIMPKTAKGMAALEEGNITLVKNDMLLDPAYNMGLGQKYVQHLASIPQIGDNLVLLLAAYNGGPAKAINWASSRQATDPLLFLESIPVRETRNYVARVLPHYWAYRARLGKPVISMRQMAEGKWPLLNLSEEANVRVASR